ncbi:MAG: SH3-like domain-containing protein [Saprospiraceae bacterium]|nr:SH3-like domain-containing protein [Saprospiraceae bacterium]
MISCDKKPKIIVEDTTAASDSMTTSQPMTTGGAAPGMDVMVHRVVANEILQTERYTYLNVTEAGKNFWIATAKVDAVKGKPYIYRGGLMKTNFESQEFKRVFDTIYLVSSVMDEQQHPGGNIDNAGVEHNHPLEAGASSAPHVHAADAVKITDLFANMKKYEGQVITVDGEIAKVNNGIMGRNWVHLQDGSKKDGKNLDLTLTTLANIPLGSHIAIKGKVVLNKDFGAGYKYNIILEESEPVQ